MDGTVRNRPPLLSGPEGALRTLRHVTGPGVRQLIASIRCIGTSAFSMISGSMVISGLRFFMQR